MGGNIYHKFHCPPYTVQYNVTAYISEENGSSVGYRVRVPDKTATLVKGYNVEKTACGREYTPQILLPSICCPTWCYRIYLRRKRKLRRLPGANAKHEYRCRPENKNQSGKTVLNFPPSSISTLRRNGTCPLPTNVSISYFRTHIQSTLGNIQSSLGNIQSTFRNIQSTLGNIQSSFSDSLISDGHSQGSSMRKTIRSTSLTMFIISMFISIIIINCKSEMKWMVEEKENEKAPCFTRGIVGLYYLCIALFLNCALVLIKA